MDVGTPAAATTAAEEEEAPSATTENAAPVPPQPRPSRLFGLYFVGNKYNPSNYWCVSGGSDCQDWELHPFLTSFRLPTAQDRTVALDVPARLRQGDARGYGADQHPLLRAGCVGCSLSLFTCTICVADLIQVCGLRCRQRPALNDAQVLRHPLPLALPRIRRRLNQSDRVLLPAPTRRDLQRPFRRQLPRLEARVAQDEEQARLGQGDGDAFGSADWWWGAVGAYEGMYGCLCRNRTVSSRSPCRGGGPPFHSSGFRPASRAGCKSFLKLVAPFCLHQRSLSSEAVPTCSSSPGLPLPLHSFCSTRSRWTR